MDGDDLLTTPLQLIVFKQYRLTYFVEGDGGHSKTKFPIDFPGFECTHCNGGKKKFFVTSAKNLYANFHGMLKHLSFCGCCPKEVEDELEPHLGPFNDNRDTRLLRQKSSRALTRIQFMEIIWKRWQYPILIDKVLK